MTSPDVTFDANVLSLYLFLWRHWEMISDLLFSKFLSASSNISSFSVRHLLFFWLYFYHYSIIYIYIKKQHIFNVSKYYIGYKNQSAAEFMYQSLSFKETQHNCFLVNFAKFLKVPILQNISWRLLLLKKKLFLILFDFD